MSTMPMGMGAANVAPVEKEKTPIMKMAAPMKKRKKMAGPPESKETPQMEAKSHPSSFLRAALAAKGKR